MPSVSLLMGILSSRHPILNNRGRLPYLHAAMLRHSSKPPHVLYCLLCYGIFSNCLLCYGIFSKNETFLIVPPVWRKADAKVTTLRHIFQTLRELFFKTSRLSGEPTGSSPKAGAKVVGSHVTAKHIQDFFLPKNDFFVQRLEYSELQTHSPRWGIYREQINTP